MRLGLLAFSLCLTSLTTLCRRVFSGMYKSAHEALLIKTCAKQTVRSCPCLLREVCPARPASWDPLWACTREKRGCQPLSHGLEGPFMKVDSKCSSTNMGVTRWLSQSSLISGSLSGLVSLWQQIMLKWSFSVQGEKWKGDLAAGGKPTGFCPQAGQGACHLVVKSTAASQVGQVPSFPQLDLTLGGNAAHIWLASVSFSSSFPPFPLVQIPKSPPVC